MSVSVPPVLHSPPSTLHDLASICLHNVWVLFWRGHKLWHDTNFVLHDSRGCLLIAEPSTLLYWGVTRECTCAPVWCVTLHACDTGMPPYTGPCELGAAWSTAVCRRTHVKSRLAVLEGWQHHSLNNANRNHLLKHNPYVPLLEFYCCPIIQVACLTFSDLGSIDCLNWVRPLHFIE